MTQVHFHSRPINLARHTPCLLYWGLIQNTHVVIADWLVRWKNEPDTDVSLPETPIQPIHQSKLEMVLNELREYWSEETVQAVAPLVEELDLEIKSITYVKPKEDENID